MCPRVSQRNGALDCASTQLRSNRFGLVSVARMLLRCSQSSLGSLGVLLHIACENRQGVLRCHMQIYFLRFPVSVSSGNVRKVNRGLVFIHGETKLRVNSEIADATSCAGGARALLCLEQQRNTVPVSGSGHGCQLEVSGILRQQQGRKEFDHRVHNLVASKPRLLLTADSGETCIAEPVTGQRKAMGLSIADSFVRRR